MSETRKRAGLVAGIVFGTALVAWWVWPRPALHLRVDVGGRGSIVDWRGRTTPLPETVFVAATGRVTRIRLENNDTTFQTLGMFSAPAKTVRNYRVEPGTFAGFCSAHGSSNTITYVVQ
ncbi:MAG: hypothetical protein U5K74_00585 [Gemmatimonadaceae bacterium]|nr:hypothetical protein [Gemmatimonadaceae bacterium]